ncbi:hypothetical protein AAG906_037192 [Vitis piasezkii]
MAGLRNVTALRTQPLIILQKFATHFWDSKKFQSKVFSQRGALVLHVLHLVGFVVFAFLTGVQSSLGLTAKSETLAFVIAFTSFFLPMLITSTMAFLLRATVKMDIYLSNSLPMLATLEASGTSLLVISSILIDLKAH